MIIPHQAATRPGASSTSSAATHQAEHTKAEIKRAAMEFESIMLSQLTAALRPETDEGSEEASLTGGQNDLVQQMFGEQLATALAKGGGIGLAELLTHEMDPNKNQAAMASPIERAAETTRHLRRDESLPSETPSVSAPAVDVASVAKITSPSNVQPKEIEPLLGLSRPRRVSELLKADATAPAGLTPVKLTVMPEAEAVKRSISDATPSQPAYKAQTRLEATIEELQQVTRPRRIIASSSMAASDRSATVKLPPAAATETVKRAAAPAASFAAVKPGYTGQPRLDALIEQASRRHGVDPHLLAAVMHTESGKRANALSNKGASGYMQIMPATFKQFAGPGKNIFDPVENINAGAAYLKFLSNKYNGSLDKVLAGYNAGIGNVERYGGVPPFKETRNFVASVKKNYRELLSAGVATTPENLATSSNGGPGKAGGLKLKPAASADGLEATLTPRAPRAATRLTGSKDATRELSANAVDLQLPIQGRISSPFGATRHHRQHKGVDIAAARGTPIEASAGGEVVYAGWTHGYGKTVLIKHQEGYYTRYAHADKLMVTRGDRVQIGQQVATVGSTGHATGPHLHFEIVQGNRRVNPLRAVADSAAERIAVKIGK